MASNRVDQKSGFDPETRIFHSLRPAVPLPPASQPLSLADYVISLLHSSADPDSLSSTPALIDHSSGGHVSFSLFLRQVRSLSLSLLRKLSLPSEKKPTTAFVLCPSSVHIPVLYFSLLSLGIAVSPANPLCSASEVAYQIHISRADLAFATSATAAKLPDGFRGRRTILVDSPEFLHMLQEHDDNGDLTPPSWLPEVRQSDVAAVLFSSGTTGRVKGVVLTHRNIIGVIAGFHAQREGTASAEPEQHQVVNDGGTLTSGGSTQAPSNYFTLIFYFS